LSPKTALRTYANRPGRKEKSKNRGENKNESKSTIRSKSNTHDGDTRDTLT